MVPKHKKSGFGCGGGPAKRTCSDVYDFLGFTPPKRKRSLSDETDEMDKGKKKQRLSSKDPFHDSPSSPNDFLGFTPPKRKRSLSDETEEQHKGNKRQRLSSQNPFYDSSSSPNDFLGFTPPKLKRSLNDERQDDDKGKKKRRLSSKNPFYETSSSTYNLWEFSTGNTTLLKRYIETGVPIIPIIPLKNILMAEQLGLGAYGIVKKGFLLPEMMPVAIKTPYFESLLIEALLLKEMDGVGGVPKLIGMTEGDHKSIVMEYVEGVTLHKYMNEVSQNEALEMIEKVKNAVGKLHDHGFAHRDLHQRNIMVDINDKVRLIDVGLARDLSDCDDPGRLKATDWLMLEYIADYVKMRSRPYWNYDYNLRVRLLKKK